MTMLHSKDTSGRMRGGVLRMVWECWGGRIAGGCLWRSGKNGVGVLKGGGGERSSGGWVVDAGGDEWRRVTWEWGVEKEGQRADGRWGRCSVGREYMRRGSGEDRDGVLRSRS